MVAGVPHWSLAGIAPKLQPPSAQPAEHGAVPVHAPTVQDTVVLAQQANPSSHTVSQSSSAPLHVSAGAMHAPDPGLAHAAVHVPVPIVPQVVVQLVG
jgi:hypothetical protein